MPIKVTCTNCGGVLHAPDDAGGKRGRCPTCGNILPIPAAAGSGGGPGLPDAPSAAPGQRPPSFADFAMGPQVGPPPSGEAPPRPAPRASLPYASASADAPPQRAARPAEAREPRRAADPFARKASLAGPPAGEPTAEGVVKGWQSCRGGLGWVQAANFLLLIPVVLLPAYYVANDVMKAMSPGNGDLIPYKNPGYLGMAGIDTAAELPLLAVGVPVVLAILLQLFGRFGVAGAPKRAAVGGPALLSALATLFVLGCAVAVAFPNIQAVTSGGDPRLGGTGLTAANSYLGLAQRLGLFFGLGAVAVGEFWFASAVGRIGAALSDGRTGARSTRYQMLLGVVAVGLIGTAALAPAQNFGLWSTKYQTPDDPNAPTPAPGYTDRAKAADGANPAFQTGQETNDQVAELWEKHVSPLFAKAGAYQPVIPPAAFLLVGLVSWLLYVRMVGAARGAIGGWLDAHAGS